MKEAGNLARSWKYAALSPAALHLPAHCSCSVFFHYSLQYVKRLFVKKKNAENDRCHLLEMHMMAVGVSFTNNIVFPETAP